MMRRAIRIPKLLVCFGSAIVTSLVFSVSHSAEPSAVCDRFSNFDQRASTPLIAVALPPKERCVVQIRNGLPIPDPKCTPGAINSTVTMEMLKSTGFRIACVRDQSTTTAQKAITYNWYGIPHPTQNYGSDQICELDHLITLELGGADTLENVWPQCGPPGVPLSQRYFKQKDVVENFLLKQVQQDRMPLSEAQRGIATDWTQFLATAKQSCDSGTCR